MVFIVQVMSIDATIGAKIHIDSMKPATQMLYQKAPGIGGFESYQNTSFVFFRSPEGSLLAILLSVRKTLFKVH